MILEVGKAGKARFIRGIKKTNIFECGPNGMVLERENNFVTLYISNNRCSKIYAKVLLGDNRILKTNKFMGVAYSENIMLLESKEYLVVVDFGERKIAVNREDVQVVGSEAWGEDPRMPWKPGYDAMFGGPAALPAQERGMDREAAREFWDWFVYNEIVLVNLLAQGGEDAEKANRRVADKLTPVFPYEKARDVEFRLDLNGEKSEFVLYHFNKEQMKADAEEFGAMMPESLTDWIFCTEA